MISLSDTDPDTRRKPDLSVRRVTRLAETAFGSISNRKLLALQRNLARTHKFIPLWQTASSRSPTYLIKDAASVRRQILNALKLGVPVSPRSIDWPSKGIIAHVVYRVAEIVDAKKPERIVGAGRAEEFLSSLLRRLPNRVIEILNRIERDALERRSEESRGIKSKKTARRKPDLFLDFLFLDLLGIYEQIGGRLVGVSTDRANDPSGPVLRFMQGCMEILCLRSVSPAGIHSRVRKLDEGRWAGKKGHEFGLMRLVHAQKNEKSNDRGR